MSDIPTSGPIKASQIASEYGISAPYTWSDLCNAAGLPTNSKASDFYGLSAEATVSCPADFTQNGVAMDPSDALVDVKVDSNGYIYSRANSGSWVNRGAWLDDVGYTPKSDYEVRATVISGSVSSGTTGSYLSCGTDRLWQRSRTSVGTSTVVLDLKIRRKDNTTNADTVRVTLSAQVTDFS